MIFKEKYYSFTCDIKIRYLLDDHHIIINVVKYVNEIKGKGFYYFILHKGKNNSITWKLFKMLIIKLSMNTFRGI